jgi:hypothetical protein
VLWRFFRLSHNLQRVKLIIHFLEITNAGNERDPFAAKGPMVGARPPPARPSRPGPFCASPLKHERGPDIGDSMSIRIVTIRGLNFAIDTSDWKNANAAKTCSITMSDALRALPESELTSLHELMSAEGADADDPRLELISKIENAAWRKATDALAMPPAFGHTATITAA